ncbi:MAG: pyruvate ferredoxin oxidoreductase, partial [Prevotella sp.]|nr:pyruvate ferredoxin oxidoreductase [Prevotella sp.]
MDYKYIEQLLEKYFECDTTLEEEQILRAFFAQQNVPIRLLPYRQLFT